MGTKHKALDHESDLEEGAALRAGELIARSASALSNSRARQRPRRCEATGIRSSVRSNAAAPRLCRSDDALLAQGRELLSVHAEPASQHIVDVLAEQR